MGKNLLRAGYGLLAFLLVALAVPLLSAAGYGPTIFTPFLCVGPGCTPSSNPIGTITDQPSPVWTGTVDQTQPSTGTLVAVVSASGAAANQSFVDTSHLNYANYGTPISNVYGTSQGSAVGTQVDNSGQNVIHVSSTSACVANEIIYDVTTSGAIAKGVYISSLTGTTATLSANLSTNTGSADHYTCDPTIKLAAATSSALQATDSVASYTNYTTVTNSAAIYTPASIAVGGNVVLNGNIYDAGGAVFGGAISGVTTLVASGLITDTQNSLGTTITPGGLWANTTPATSGNQQISPAQEYCGNGWGTTGSASQQVCQGWYELPVQGATPTGRLTLGYSINGGAWATTGTFFDTSGNAYIGRSLEQLTGSTQLCWAGGPCLTNSSGSIEIQLSHNVFLTVGSANGIMLIGTTNGAADGSLLLANLTASGTITNGATTVSGLPSGVAGKFLTADVSDANASCSAGTTPTGGGSNYCEVKNNNNGGWKETGF